MRDYKSISIDLKEELFYKGKKKYQQNQSSSSNIVESFKTGDY